MRNLKKNILSGLAISLVLAMAIGSFAISEAQTPVTPQAAEPQVAATNDDSTGAFKVEGGSYGEDADYHFESTTDPDSGNVDRVLYIHPQNDQTEITVSNEGSTTDRIEITPANGGTITNNVKIILAGVKIETSTGSAIKIQQDAAFNVNITLKNGSENTLTSTAGSGLEKSVYTSSTASFSLTVGAEDNSKNPGKLTATGSNNAAGIGGFDYSSNNIYITGGIIKAYGGQSGAGIGGGNSEYMTNMNISGGEVEAYGGYGAAGIGGSGSGGLDGGMTISGGKVTAASDSSKKGNEAPGIGSGSGGTEASGINITGGIVIATGGDSGCGIGPARGFGSGNTLSGNAIVLATSGSRSTQEPLKGFNYNGGIAFTHKDTEAWTSEMYGDVTFTQDVEIPADFTIPYGKTISIEKDKEVTLSSKDGAKYKVEGTLKNDGTVTLPTDIEVKGNGTITTRTHFYLADGTTYGTDDYYQTYQTKAGVQKYKDLPNPDDTTLLKNSLNSDKFLYWYYLDKDGKEVAIKDGDAGDNVLPNQHKFYEKREEAYSISTSKQGEGTITPNVSEAYKGDEVTFIVTPAEGYELKEGSLSVKAGDKDVEFTEKDGKYTFTMPGAAVQVSAVFEQIPEPTPTPPGPGPEPTPTPEPTPEPTPDPSVDPDGGDGSGGASAKTSDPFMGGMALALLGVATTGAILTRKFK